MTIYNGHLAQSSIRNSDTRSNSPVFLLTGLPPPNNRVRLSRNIFQHCCVARYKAEQQALNPVWLGVRLFGCFTAEILLVDRCSETLHHCQYLLRRLVKLILANPLFQALEHWGHRRAVHLYKKTLQDIFSLGITVFQFVE